MNTQLEKFKINVMHFTYEITGLIVSEQVVNQNGFTDIYLRSVNLEKVIQVNHEDQRIPLSPLSTKNMSADILANPMKYPQIIWFLQEQYEGDRWDLRHECEQMDREDRREYLDSQESC